MKKIFKRLGSPVVIIQLITIIGAAVVLLMPETDEFVQKTTIAISAIINTFAGLNNPTDSDNF